MEPKFEAGYRVIFSPNNEARNGDYVVARLSEGHGVLFKRFRRTGSEGQTIRLESLNPAYAPMEYSASAFRFIYPAVEFRCALPR
jgi:SOS-response transcriptional repressor LexA